MKNYLISLILFIFLWFTPKNAVSAYVTGDTLKLYCSSEESGDVIACANYIAGIIDYHVFMQTMGVMHDFGFCIPEGVTIEAASFVVMKYLKSSPYYDPFIGASSVIMALHSQYPCKTGG